MFVPFVLYIKPLYLLYNDNYKKIVPGREIYHSIYKSKQKNNSKIILLGDSVGNQLFSNKKNNDTINSLACNQAISMAGQYILLKNYINEGNKFDKVYLIFTPFSFQNNLDQVYTYHYFIKPFYLEEYKKEFTEIVTQQINKIPYISFSREPYILTSSWAPDFISKDEINNEFLSAISIEYLIKIKKLSIKHNFEFIILPTPICLSKKEDVEKMDKNNIIKNNLSHEFKRYFQNMIYLEDNFFVDGTHLKKEKLDYFVEYFKNKLLEKGLLSKQDKQEFINQEMKKIF